MKEFVFLYPIPEYIDTTCNPLREDRGVFEAALNDSIDQRYRQQGFGINYVIFDGHAISDAVKIQPTDKIIEAGIDFKTHTTKKPDGTYEYPDPSHILKLLSEPEVIRIAGFHLWSCVEFLAKEAYERGMDVLVDEDLTEILPGRIDDPNFRTDTYPTYDLHSERKGVQWIFMKAREGKPWLWQNY